MSKGKSIRYAWIYNDDQKGGIHMSKCCRPAAPVALPTVNNNCICSFPTLIILILIVLQFSRCNKHYGDGDDEGGCNQVGNGILFIIALFFLSCSGCGRGSF